MTRPHPAADRGTYIGLLRDDARRACDEIVRAGGRPVCCADRPEGERSYICLCGDVWRLTQDGWINLGDTVVGDRISIRHAAREA